MNSERYLFWNNSDPLLYQNNYFLLIKPLFLPGVDYWVERLA